MATHLATRSSYSLLQSTLTIEKLVSLAKQRGFTQLAITENGVLYSAKAFEKACLKANIKPIYGLEIVLDDDRLIVLAKNNAGYLELIELSSRICDGEELTIEEIARKTHDCVVIQQSEQGILETPLLNEDMAKATEILSFRNQLFRDYVCGISMMESSLFAAKNNKLISLCKELNIPAVALPKVYYTNPEDEDAYRVLRAIDLNLKIDNPTLINQPYRSLLSHDDMEKIYGQTLCLEADAIGKRCNVDLSEITTSLPVYENTSDVSSDVYLRQLCQVGLSKRFSFKSVPKEYEERLQYELDVITRMNYSDYFLIVYDFILYANRNGIYVGPGRGSAAGSLVAYSLGITHVDPIEYNLFFERFLNPERISMPDIDTDFPDNRRDEIIEYLIEKYGNDHIAHIITFGTLAQKQVIRDVGRVYNAPKNVIDQLLDALVKRLGATLNDSIKESKALKFLLKENKTAKQIVDMALQIEGLPKNRSTHAAGIVMSQKPLHEVVPTTRLEGTSHYVTQYSMDYLEEMGLVKMDLLGLRNLTIIDEVVTEIKKSEPQFNILKIDLSDSKTYKLIQNVQVVGIFQLESSGMRALIKEVQPSKFMDLADTIALYRPGPMRFRQQYVTNKRNPQSIKYLHPDLKKITESTHGILIYQEQIMQVASKFAGFTLGKADRLRRAMSKKDSQEMSSLKDDFIEGCISNGYTRKLAEMLFELIDRFAAYGFNKSHSVAYGMIAYQMAFLKANYPLYFYKALLSSVIGSTTKLKEYLTECSNRQIKLLGPSVNHSGLSFELEGDAIRLPLSIISSIGSHSARKIIDLREKKGPFKTFIDFIALVNTIGINQSQLKNLIYAGACDEFGFNRSTFIASLDDVLAYADLIKIETVSNQNSLDLGETEVKLNYGLVNEPLMTIRTENKLYLSQKEKDVLGFYFKYHPILEVKRNYHAKTYTLHQANQRVRIQSQVIAMLLSVKEIRSKKGDLMAFVTLEDELDKVEGIVFHREYDKIKDKLIPNHVYLIEGEGQKDRAFILKNVTQLDLK